MSNDRPTPSTDLSAGVTDAYASLAEHYHFIYADWHTAMQRQAAALDRVIRAGLGPGQRPGLGPGQRTLLDASCGIGTQALGLAQLGYRVHATDLSAAELERARREAAALGLQPTFALADMRALPEQVPGSFDVVLSADNAIAHLLTGDDLLRALRGMRAKLNAAGLLVLTLRDYDALLRDRARATAPAVFDGPEGRRIVLHVFDWEAGSTCYRTNLFIVRQAVDSWTTLHWSADSRAWRRAEIEVALADAGLAEVRWWTPDESGFFQPLVTARPG